MLSCVKIDNYTYQIDLSYRSPINNNICISCQNEKFNNDCYNCCNYISECSDPTCIYTRNNSNIREKFEKKIHHFVGNKNNINILFYSSYMLFQELKILRLLGNKVLEVHLVDYAYIDFIFEDGNKYYKVFQQFLCMLRVNGIYCNVFVHTSPIFLKTNVTFYRRFDLVCGIDIDYTDGCMNNRPIMKEISQYVLKNDGSMYVSQHFEDQVDLCVYKLDDNGNIKLEFTQDYVKPSYIKKYLFENIYAKLYYLLILLIAIMVSYHNQYFTEMYLLPKIFLVINLGYCLFAIVKLNCTRQIIAFDELAPS